MYILHRLFSQHFCPSFCCPCGRPSTASEGRRQNHGHGCEDGGGTRRQVRGSKAVINWPIISRVGMTTGSFFSQPRCVRLHQFVELSLATLCLEIPTQSPVAGRRIINLRPLPSQAAQAAADHVARNQDTGGQRRDHTNELEDGKGKKKTTKKSA